MTATGDRCRGRARRRCSVVILTILWLIPLLPAAADSTESTGRFAGFEGVVVGCVYRAGTPLAARVCEQARARIGLAAARAGIRLVLAPDNDRVERRIQARAIGAVILKCELSVTTAGGAASPSIHARLSLGHPYRAAVDRSAADGAAVADPRGGWLELWAQDIIAAGADDELVTATADALERLASNGFSAYRDGGGALDRE